MDITGSHAVIPILCRCKQEGVAEPFVYHHFHISDRCLQVLSRKYVMSYLQEITFCHLYPSPTLNCNGLTEQMQVNQPVYCL